MLLDARFDALFFLPGSSKAWVSTGCQIANAQDDGVLPRLLQLLVALCNLDLAAQEVPFSHEKRIPPKRGNSQADLARQPLLFPLLTRPYTMSVPNMVHQ